MLFTPSKNFSESNFKLLNILFSCFPISFLVGNGMTNIIIFLICLIGIFTFSNELHLVKKDKATLSFLAFFVILFVSTLLDIVEDPKNDHFLKSIAYFRYFFLFLVTSFFIKSGKFNFKYFLIVSFICTFPLSLDIAYQSINGSDFLGFKGYEKSKYHLGGFIQNEYIAGGYIQKFFIFSLIFFPFVSKKLEKQKFIISIFLTIVFFLGILYSGNRMPMVMFTISIFLIIIFIKDLRLPLMFGILLCSTIFYISYNNNEKIKTPYYSFYDNTSSMWKNIKMFAFKEYPELESQKGTGFKFKHYIELLKEFKYQNEKLEFLGDRIRRNEETTTDLEAETSKYKILRFGSGHAVIYLTAIDLWTDSPIVGNGIKSFRIKCSTKLYKPNRVCEGHPHNYYLELLNDTGLTGTLVFLLSLFFLLKNKFLNLKKYKKKEKLLIICIFIILFSELFPIKSTGSFFSTSSSTYIFFILGVLSGLKKIKI